MARRTLESLGTLVKETRGSRKLREVAAEIGISPATLMRIENGRTPDIGTFGKVCTWLKIDPRELMGIPRETESVETERERIQVSAHLRANRMPDQETLKALVSMIALAVKLQPPPSKELQNGDV